MKRILLGAIALLMGCTQPLMGSVHLNAGLKSSFSWNGNLSQPKPGYEAEPKQEAAESLGEWADPMQCLTTLNGNLTLDPANTIGLADSLEVGRSLHLPVDEGAPEEVRYSVSFQFPREQVLSAYCSIMNIDGNYIQVLFPGNNGRWVYLTKSSSGYSFEMGNPPHEGWADF